MVILGGYEDLIKRNLFPVQPGLESRFLPPINIAGYTTDELVTMFATFALTDLWMIGVSRETLVKIFSKNKDKLAHYGRDVKMLLYFAELEWAASLTDVLDYSVIVRELNESHVSKAFERFKNREADKYPAHLYT